MPLGKGRDTMFGLFGPGERYPYQERDYNENLSNAIPFALANASQVYRLPEAVRYPGVIHSKAGDLPSILVNYRRREADRVGVQTNARRYG